MTGKLLWILGGATFGLALGLLVGSTPIGIVICVLLGAAAGWLSEKLERRRTRR